MTTKNAPVRPVGSMTKQIVSFGASFAFFGLAGFLQNGAFFETETATAAPTEASSGADISDAVNDVVPDGEEVVASENATVEWLGPVQPLPAEAQAPAVDAVDPTPAPEPAPAAAPAPAPAAAPAPEPAPAPAPEPAPAPAPEPAPAPAPVEVPVDAHTGGS